MDWRERTQKMRWGINVHMFHVSPFIYGNVWSVIVMWTLTIKISQVPVPRGGRYRLGSNHYGFTVLMTGRELIYHGEKQIKALLSPAHCHTIAYINILSWAIQVSKGLVHLHLHKGPLSTLWPPLPLSSPPDECLHCPLLHLPVFLPFTLLTTSLKQTPTVSCLLFSSISSSC